MRRKKLLLVGVLLLALTVLVPAAAVADGGGNNAGLAGTKQPQVFQMTPGQHLYGDATSMSLGPGGGWTIHVVVNMGPGTGSYKTVVEDCCIMGDTMLALALGPGGPLFDWGTSPGALQLGPVAMPQYGFKIVVVGYLDCPGGFPAGWYWDHWM
jgi:hypothetical protein